MFGYCSNMFDSIRSTGGNNDNTTWETSPTPKTEAISEWDNCNTPTLPPIKPPQDARSKRYAENLHKSRCPHGVPFYHASAHCWSCNLETAEYDGSTNARDL